MSKLVKVGNSDAIIIPKNLMEKHGWTTGQEVNLSSLPTMHGIIIHSEGEDAAVSDLTPEFFSWLKNFNKKYKTALTELANK